jgi:hypothetical protein
MDRVHSDQVAEDAPESKEEVSIMIWTKRVSTGAPAAVLRSCFSPL